MNPAHILRNLKSHFGEVITAVVTQDNHPRAHTTAEHWRAVAQWLRNEPAAAMDWLACITAVDYLSEGKLCAVYDLYSTQHGHRLAVKVYVARDKPSIASVADLWPAADWHEREAYDLMGIRFEGHSDLRRILLPEDWEGHPLRKDYVFPREYHGIPALTQSAAEAQTPNPKAG
jgi:NADH-quinone oxidoreductase subunit C